MEITEIEEDSLCEVCEHQLRRKCTIGFKIHTGAIADSIKDNNKFWGTATGIEYPEIGLAVIKCNGFKRLHSV